MDGWIGRDTFRWVGRWVGGQMVDKWMDGLIERDTQMGGRLGGWVNDA